MLEETLSTKLQQWQQKTLTRVRPVISQCENNRITVNDKNAIQFASSDYLALNRHPLITETSTRALQQYGLGSGASAMVVGYSDYHQQLEEIAAKWLQVDQVILFSSGYLANIGVLQSLISRHDSIAADKLCHASLLTGMQLTRAKQYRYSHLDMQELQKILMNNAVKLIVTESVFSMQGDIAPIEAILSLAKDYNTGVIIDDAHGVGVLGEHGGGITEALAIPQQAFSCLILPCGKALQGMGAIVAGRKEIIDAILQFSPSYRYNTALSPVIVAGMTAAIQLIQQETWRRQRLQQNIETFNQYAIEYQLPLVSKEKTPIRIVRLGDTVKVLQLQDYLLEQGYYVAAIRSPTVINKHACLRISLNALHEESEIKQLLTKISDFLS